jgi:uncharacterized protein (DUF427 family)
MTDTAHGQVKIAPAGKRVRAYLGGELVADTIAPMLVWEKPSYPTYYFPSGDLRASWCPPGRSSIHRVGATPRYTTW